MLRNTGLQVGRVASCRLSSRCWEPQGMRSDLTPTLCTKRLPWGHEGHLGNWTPRGTPGAQDSKPQIATGFHCENIKALDSFIWGPFLEAPAKAGTLAVTQLHCCCTTIKLLEGTKPLVAGVWLSERLLHGQTANFPQWYSRLAYSEVYPAGMG